MCVCVSLLLAAAPVYGPLILHILQGRRRCTTWRIASLGVAGVSHGGLDADAYCCIPARLRSSNVEAATGTRQSYLRVLVPAGVRDPSQGATPDGRHRMVPLPSPAWGEARGEAAGGEGAAVRFSWFLRSENIGYCVSSLLPELFSNAKGYKLAPYCRPSILRVAGRFLANPVLPTQMRCTSRRAGSDAGVGVTGHLALNAGCPPSPR